MLNACHFLTKLRKTWTAVYMFDNLPERNAKRQLVLFNRVFKCRFYYYSGMGEPSDRSFVFFYIFRDAWESKDYREPCQIHHSALW